MTLLEKLTQIRERAERATPGPWTVELSDEDCHGVYRIPEIRNLICYEPDRRKADLFEKQNAEFIAAARTDVPRLVAALKTSLSRLGDCCICENTNQCWACRSLADITRIMEAP